MAIEWTCFDWRALTNNPFNKGTVWIQVGMVKRSFNGTQVITSRIDVTRSSASDYIRCVECSQITKIKKLWHTLLLKNCQQSIQCLNIHPSFPALSSLNMTAETNGGSYHRKRSRANVRPLFARNGCSSINLPGCPPNNELWGVGGRGCPMSGAKPEDLRLPIGAAMAWTAGNSP